MNLERVNELKIEAEAERLSYGEIAEIEAAFADVPDHALRDLRENATATDMLEEIGDWLHFSAVLAKNNIAAEIASSEPNVNYILSELKDIEKFTGELNQPSVEDSYTAAGDYAHCANCDAVINMDHDTFTVKDDRTLCGNCS